MLSRLRSHLAFCAPAFSNQTMTYKLIKILIKMVDKKIGLNK